MSAPADFVIPNRVLQRYVLANEKVIIATHRHWAMLWEPILTTAAAFFLGLAILVAVDPVVRDDMGWVWLPFAVLGARLVYKWLEWRAKWFVMTDRRLMLLDGFIVHRVAMMPSEKVTDLGYERSPLGQVLGYGTFVLETAGQDQALDRVDWVPRPDARYRLIIAALFHPDAADAEAAAQSGSPEVRPPAAPPEPASPAAPPPALMPRIGRRSNPPTQRIELPVSRENAAAGSAAGTATGGAGATEGATEDTTLPGSTEPTGATRPPSNGGTAPAATGRGTGEHVPGGPTANPDASDALPKPFIEGGKDPKMR